MRIHLFPVFVVLAIVVVLTACGKPSSSPTETENPTIDLNEILERGELRVATIVGAESYYTRISHDRGRDYLMAMNFADYIDVSLKWVVAPDVEAMKDSLQHGVADFAAYNVIRTNKNQENFLYVDWNVVSQPVLVQRKTKHGMITSTTQMVGKTIYVKSHSKHLRRMKHLNWEIGGGVVIEEAADSLSMEDLIWMVSVGNIDYAVADNDLAILSQQRLRNIDCSLPLGTHTSKTWIVRADAPLLREKLNEWYAHPDNSAFFAKLKKSQSVTSRNGGYERTVKVPPLTPQGDISPYDSLLKENAARLGWDWRLLAALIYTESKFNCNVISRQGALGLMQMMPSTARRYGLTTQTALDPVANMHAGTNYLMGLCNSFSHIKNKNEQAKFVLASYNAGYGHVQDAVRLAKKYGANPEVWDGNVEKFLLLKSEPQYYNDEVCRCGYFSAGHTIRYIERIFSIYERYKKNTTTQTE
ncbi:MAG: transglycosylase SLT domain-containing protein [Bacteroidales bacterium]|nr:transglycosylase SLT domain-containing protein [Bacteroidales bacterium]